MGRIDASITFAPNMRKNPKPESEPDIGKVTDAQQMDLAADGQWNQFYSFKMSAKLGNASAPSDT
ncbi:MAG: hypothetical protein QOG23_5034, partial [Blastocatellia bacterium]|nr:hypothetical protein [Blastocatellia bacterium]